MERLLISQLLKWKDSHGRQPLILEGARQVGKTWLLKEFGRKYFKEVSALGISCTSSKIIRVSSGILILPLYIESCSIMRCGDKSPANISSSTSLCSQLIWHSSLNYLLPNSFISQFFPTCLASSSMGRFLPWLSFHFNNWDISSLSIR